MGSNYLLKRLFGMWTRVSMELEDVGTRGLGLKQLGTIHGSSSVVWYGIWDIYLHHIQRWTVEIILLENRIIRILDKVSRWYTIWLYLFNHCFNWRLWPSRCASTPSPPYTQWVESTYYTNVYIIGTICPFLSWKKEWNGNIFSGQAFLTTGPCI